MDLDEGDVGAVEAVLPSEREEVVEGEDRLEKKPNAEDSCARSLPVPKVPAVPLLPLTLLPSVPWSVR